MRDSWIAAFSLRIQKRYPTEGLTLLQAFPVAPIGHAKVGMPDTARFAIRAGTKMKRGDILFRVSPQLF